MKQQQIYTLYIVFDQSYEEGQDLVIVWCMVDGIGKVYLILTCVLYFIANINIVWFKKVVYSLTYNYQ